ncbi:16834_t:CDS:1, partial [Gigaspora rosea]
SHGTLPVCRSGGSRGGGRGTNQGVSTGQEMPGRKGNEQVTINSSVIEAFPEEQIVE